MESISNVVIVGGGIALLKGVNELGKKNNRKTH